MTNKLQGILDAQKARFLTDATKSCDWRNEQLDRLERMLREHRDELPPRLQAIAPRMAAHDWLGSYAVRGNAVSRTTAVNS